MSQHLITTFADQFNVPLPAVRRLAAALAEECALIANRHEPTGELECIDLGMAEAIGAQIGAAILEAFPEPSLDRQATALELGWGQSGNRRR